MTNSGSLKSFAKAGGFLPERLWRAIYSLGDDEKKLCEEFRIRVGQKFTANVGGTSKILTDLGQEIIITKQDVQELLASATESSVHTYANNIASGFVPLDGGHRLGVCGEAIINDGTIRGFRDFYSCNLRIAHEICGISKPLLPYLFENKRFLNTLVISPPGAGKTTLLRDIIFNVSQQGQTISLIDERYEIAACHNCVQTYNVGQNTDIISGCPKSEGIEIMLRAMAPQIVAIDEITTLTDCQSIIKASYCGCAFLATAHAFGKEELCGREVYRELLSQNLFERIIEIKKINGVREYKIFETGCVADDKAARLDDDSCIVCGDRFFNELRPF